MTSGCCKVGVSGGISCNGASSSGVEFVDVDIWCKEGIWSYGCADWNVRVWDCKGAKSLLNQGEGLNPSGGDCY